MEGSGASEQDSVTCRLCNEAFQKPSSLLNHLITAHNIGPQVKDNHLCPLCGIRNTEYHAHRDHLLYCHRHKTVGEKHDFKTFSDFLVWKNELELQQKTKYVCQNSCNILSKNYKRYYYQCCHSGVFRAGSVGNKFKTRMESTCPSMISVIEYADSNEVKVEFWDTHFGHRGTELNENSNAELSTGTKETDDSSIYVIHSDKDNLIKTTVKTNELTSQNNLDYTKQLSNSCLFSNNNTFDSTGATSSILQTVSFIPNTIFRSFPVSSLPDQSASTNDTSVNKYKKIKPCLPEEQLSKKKIKSKLNNDKINSTKTVTENSNILMQNGNNNITNLPSGNQVILINTVPNEQAAPINGNVCTIAQNNTLLNMVALNGSAGNPVFLNNVVQSALPSNLVPGSSSQVPMGQVFYTTVPMANQLTSTSNSSVACTTTTSTISLEDNAKMSPIKKSTTNLLPSGEPRLWEKIPINAPPKNKKKQLVYSPSVPVPSLITENVTSVLTNSKTDNSSQNLVLNSAVTGSTINDKNIPAGKLPISRINTFRNQTASSLTAGNQVILINSMPFGQVSQIGGNICTMAPTTVIGASRTPVPPMFISSSSLAHPANNNLVSMQNPLLPISLTPAVSSQTSAGQVYYTKIPHAGQSSLTSKVPAKESDISMANTFLASKNKLNSTSKKNSTSTDEDNSELFGMDDNSVESSSEDNAMSLDDNLVGLAASTNSSDTQSSFSNLVSVACSKNKIAVPSKEHLSSRSQSNTKVDASKNIIFKNDELASNNPVSSGASKVQASGAVSRTLIGNFSVRSYATTKPKESEKAGSKPVSTSPSKYNTTKSSRKLSNKTSPSSKFVCSSEVSLSAKSLPVLTSQSLTKAVSVTTSTLSNMSPLSSVLNSNKRTNFINAVSNTMTSNTVASQVLNKDVMNTEKCNSNVQPLSVTTLPLSLLQNTQNSTLVIPSLSNSDTTLIEDSGNLYMLEPVEDEGIPTSNSTELTPVVATNLEKRSNIGRHESTIESSNLRNSPIDTCRTNLAKSRENFNSDTHILQKIEFYKLEMKYLASQEECKRLKIALAKAELKNHSHIEDDPDHRRNIEQEIKDANLEVHSKEQVLIKALESSFGSDNDLDIYSLVRSSVLHNFESTLEDLSETNKQLIYENTQLSDEIKEYRRKEEFYKLLQTKFSEEDF